MGTARVVVDGLEGFAAPATLYQIDPPMLGTDHLILYHRPKMHLQVGQMTVILGTEGGGSYSSAVIAVQGTYLTDEPNHALALQLAGGYSIVREEPNEPGLES